METFKRKVKSGAEYDHLFPRAKGRTRTVKRDANVSHTVNFIPRVVKATRSQTALIARLLKGRNIYETCKKVFDFVYPHITYEKDAHGVEQVRSPARTWADRHEGVDCDCYTTFISSLLYNLRIPHILRIAKYKKDHFQHIYPIIPTPNGRYITIDPVVHQFDKEEPYTEIKDTQMDLEYLDGIEETFENLPETENPEMGELGRIKFFQKIGDKIKTVANAVNKVNPATVLLRNGLLASMKLNVMKVAGKLRWAYLTEAQARQKGMLPAQYSRLKQVLAKTESVFYAAGGKPENLKAAILTGKGNSDRQVLAGLGEVDMNSLNESIPLPVLLGSEIFESENEGGTEGLGVVTTTMIAAASAAVAAIAGSIKQIGDLFPKGNRLNESGTDEGNPNTESVDLPPDTSLAPVTQAPNLPTSISTDLVQQTPTTENPPKEEGFWDKNKKWLKPTLWGAGALTVLGIGYKVVFGGKKKEEGVSGLEGPPKKKAPPKPKPKPKDKEKKTPIALM